MLIALAALAAAAGASPLIDPVPLADAAAALAAATDTVCPWFLSGENYSLDRARTLTAEEGFRRGASVAIVPLPEMAAQGAYGTLGYQAAIANAPAEGNGVALLASLHTPVCQVQLYGYRAEGDRFLTELTQRGWRPHGSRRTFDRVTIDRWMRRIGSHDVTLVVSRWRSDDPPNGLGMVVNLLPGIDTKRGEVY